MQQNSAPNDGCFFQSSENSLTAEEILQLPYFLTLSKYTSTKQCLAVINKCINRFKLVKISKGSIICDMDTICQSGYIILHGNVELLHKKSNRDKLNTYPNHTISSDATKIKFLQSNFGFNEEKAQSLINFFFQQKLIFKYVVYTTLYGQGSFGFGQMVRNSLNTCIAIATQNTTVLQIDKQSFDYFLCQSHKQLQTYLMQCFFHSIQEDIVKMIKPKAMQLMNSASLVILQNHQILYQENSLSQSLYLILEGECEISKSILIKPSQKQSEGASTMDNKPIQLKINRIVPNDLIGEAQILLGNKTRQFTITASMNSTTLVKFDHNLFLKVVSQLIEYEKVAILNAKLKYSKALDCYERKKKQIVKVYMKNMQLLETKKKQKMLANGVEQGKMNKRNEIFEVFNQQGIFYRDSFEKLEGFDSFNASYDQSKNAIKRNKVQIKNNPTHQNSQESQNKFRLSENNLDALNYISDTLASKIQKKILKSQKNFKARKSAQKTTNKFKILQKDQQVFKLILIKNGLYTQSKIIDKSNISKPIVHPNFDPIIKQCISRKNQSLRKAIQSNKFDVVRDNYVKSVKSIKIRSISMKKFESQSKTCKGIDQMRRRMSLQKINRESIPSSPKRQARTVELQSDFGVKLQPRRSIIPMSCSQFRKYEKNDQNNKIVLLNHMMKPIVYSSSKQYPTQ